ncbi:ribosomal-protein-alanine N-acetyltransferase [Marinomonas spartinae]|uniref:GNAT family N-acetyltransferase n=1 Tax=Marinomonas spartinae TaxID=1792290 RepID=UPI000808E05C|nr:GNAT family N-acetyltransferase [Marinomonas spartinae]SBS39024.1 ribosomal-protein-alanine N-acetyltransferase [Marinomonas spartinae]
MTHLVNLQQHRIRSASINDLEAIVSLDMDSNPHPWGENLIKDALATRQNWAIESCDEQGSINISAWLTASMLFEQSELELIVVDRFFRRQGLARKLMTHWFDAIKRQNMGREQPVSECLLEVRESNLGAITLYKSLGFELMGRRKNYYQSEQGNEAALLFNLTISYQGERP